MILLVEFFSMNHLLLGILLQLCNLHNILWHLIGLEKHRRQLIENCNIAYSVNVLEDIEGNLRPYNYSEVCKDAIFLSMFIVYVRLLLTLLYIVIATMLFVSLKISLHVYGRIKAY